MLKIAMYLQRCRRDRRGFTLVELLVVVAILGILAAIAVPRVTQNIQSARVGADIANERMILNALEAYYLEITPTGPRLLYPGTLNDPTFVNTFFGSAVLPQLPTGLLPPYLPYEQRYIPTTVHVGGAVYASGFRWNSPNGLTTTRP